MKPEELIKLILKRAQEHRERNKGLEETDEIINKISQNLYLGLKQGALRRLTVHSLKEIFRNLPKNPNEEEIDIRVKLVEALILTVISCILSEGEIITVAPTKDKDKKRPGEKYEI